MENKGIFTKHTNSPLKNMTWEHALINNKAKTYMLLTLKPSQYLLPRKLQLSEFWFQQLSYSPSPFLSPHQQVMDIQARLMDYKFHFMVAIIVSVVMSSLVYAAPRVLDILAYFWPLFASTAAFLAIAITFGGFQQLSDEATGEGIMDYVAGRPDDSHKYN